MKVNIKAPFIELALEMDQGRARLLVEQALELAQEEERANRTTNCFAAERNSPMMPDPAGDPERATSGRLSKGETQKSRVERLFGARSSWNSGAGQRNPPALKSEGDTERATGGRPDKKDLSGKEPEEPDITMEDVMAAMDAPKEKLYKGFLWIRCDGCGRVRGVNVKMPTSEFNCACGAKMPLAGSKAAAFSCSSCGKSFRYRTNLRVSSFEIECLNCKAPNTLMFNQRKNRYEG